MSHGRRRLTFGAAALLALPARHGLAQGAPAPVLALRHAQTEPGIGDPPGFVLGRCDTQRNLSSDGREQARRLGERLAARGWRPQRLRSSRWCRCLDTAQGVAVGLGAPAPTPEPWTALDSFFGGREREPAQTAALRERLRALRGARGLVELWVTHQVNLSALTGQGLDMGQALWLDWRSDGTLSVRPFDA